MKPVSLFAAFLLSVVAIGFPSAVEANGYVGGSRSSDVARELAFYDAVFVGQVIEMKLLTDGTFPPKSRIMLPVNGVIVKFRVLREFKRPGKRNRASREYAHLGYPFDDELLPDITVRSIRDGLTDYVPYKFELGQKYLVWARSGSRGLDVYGWFRPMKLPDMEAQGELDDLIRLTSPSSGE